MGWIRRIMGGSSSESDKPEQPSGASPKGGGPGQSPAGRQGAQQPAAAAEVIARWDKAIAKVQARFDGVLDEARQASVPLVAATQADLGPLTRLWCAVETKKHKHTGKIADRWDRISDELSELDELPDAIMDQQGVKRDLAQCEVEVRYYRAYREVMAQAAAQMQQWATTSGDPSARSVFAGSGALCLAQQVAIDSWEAMTRADIQMNQYRKSRDVPMALLEQYQSAATEYWTTLLNVEARHVPDIAQHVPLKLQGYLKTVEKKLRGYWQWRERQSK